MVDAPVLSHCSLLRNTSAKPTGVLEHCREGETNCWFSIFRGVSFWQQPQGDEGCDDVMSGTNLWDRFPSCSIPANYTSEFRENFEATAYIKSVLHCVMEFGALRPIWREVYLTPRSALLRERLTGLQFDSPHFMEPKGLLPCWQEPTIFPVRSPINLDYILPPAYFWSILILFSHLCPDLQSGVFRFPHQNPVYISPPYILHAPPISVSLICSPE
jgi:hypothetical protein